MSLVWIASAYNVEWDERKDRANKKKHRISFEEAATTRQRRTYEEN
jgi:uncharacterized DUF497 family protein